MKELEEILRNIKDFKGYQLLNENKIKENLEEIKDNIDIEYEHIKAENIEDKEEEFKRLRFSIKNILSRQYIISNSIDKDRIKSLAEKIAKEYLK